MGAIARIIARYGIGTLTGYLVAKGLPVEGLADDPDVVFVIEMGLTAGIPAAMAFVVERYYWLAKRYGWPL